MIASKTEAEQKFDFSLLLFNNFHWVAGMLVSVYLCLWLVLTTNSQLFFISITSIIYTVFEQSLNLRQTRTNWYNFTFFSSTNRQNSIMFYSLAGPGVVFCQTVVKIGRLKNSIMYFHFPSKLDIFNAYKLCFTH